MARPMGLRAVATMTASGMAILRAVGRWAEQGYGTPTVLAIRPASSQTGRARSISGAVCGGPISIPWTWSQPSSRRRTSWLTRSTPSAVTSEVQRVPEVGDGRDDGLVVAPLAKTPHEAAVDLDGFRREALQVVQRRVAGAEVVDGEADPEPAELVQDVAGPLDVDHQCALGDLEPDAARVERRAGQGIADLLDELGAAELPGREVDGDRQAVGALAETLLPGRQLLHGPVHHQLPDGDDEPGVLRQLDEVGGRDDAPLGMVPAHQRLEAGQPARAELHDGLEEEGELVAVDGPVQVVAEVVEPDDGVAVGRFEVLDAVPAPVLGLVHRGVGVPHQALRGHPGPVGLRHADAGRHEALPVEQRHRLGDHLGQVVGQRVDAAAPVGVGQEDDELVAAEAGHRGVVARGEAYPLTHRLHDTVAGGVAEAVVDELEPVDVEEDEAERLPGRAPDERRGQPLHERRPVEQPGQLVVVGRVGQALGDGVLARDVLHLADQVAPAVGLLDDRDAGVADEHRAAGVLVVEAVAEGGLRRCVRQHAEELLVGAQLARRPQLAEVPVLEPVGRQPEHGAERGVDLDEVTVGAGQEHPDGGLLERDPEALLGLPQQRLLAEADGEVPHRDDETAHRRLLDVAPGVGLHRRVRAVGLEHPEQERAPDPAPHGGGERVADAGEVLGVDELEDRPAHELRRSPARAGR